MFQIIVRCTKRLRHPSEFALSALATKSLASLLSPYDTARAWDFSVIHNTRSTSVPGPGPPSYLHLLAIPMCAELHNSLPTGHGGIIHFRGDIHYVLDSFVRLDPGSALPQSHSNHCHSGYKSKTLGHIHWKQASRKSVCPSPFVVCLEKWIWVVIRSFCGVLRGSCTSACHWHSHPLLDYMSNFAPPEMERPQGDNDCC
jgi:hypothetical protein